MPLYEYRCRDCGEEFEELVKMNTPTESIACPTCGQHHAERKLSMFASRSSSGSSGYGSAVSSALSSSSSSSCGPAGSGFT